VRPGSTSSSSTRGIEVAHPLQPGHAALRNGELGPGHRRLPSRPEPRPATGDSPGQPRLRPSAASQGRHCPPGPRPVVSTLLFGTTALSRRELLWAAVMAKCAPLAGADGPALPARVRECCAGCSLPRSLVVVATAGSLAVRSLLPTRTVVIVSDRGSRPTPAPAPTPWYASSSTPHRGAGAGSARGWIRIALPEEIRAGSRRAEAELARVLTTLRAGPAARSTDEPWPVKARASPGAERHAILLGLRFSSFGVETTRRQPARASSDSRT